MDVHPPHGPVHSWKDFWIHLGTISIGLLIALSLEQSVEWMHHVHERHRLEEDVREELRSDVKKDAHTIRQLDALRSYLVELKVAVDAQRTGKVGHAPAATDARRTTVMMAPAMAAWEGAKESGTPAFLPSSEIRLYDRVLFQLDYWHNATADFDKSCQALESFEERFLDQRGMFQMGDRVVAPSLVGMSSADLQEYSVLLANSIKSLDGLYRRYQNVDAECQALLDGARTEDDLVRMAMGRVHRATPGEGGNDAPGAPRR
jgi:hypothetical protein